MPPVRTHAENTRASVPAKAAQPQHLVGPRPGSWDYELAKLMQIGAKSRLVSSALPILASSTATKAEKLKAAEDLKEGTHGNVGMSEVLGQYGDFGEALVDCSREARQSHESFLRYAPLVYDAVEVYGLAGKALVDLNRPKKHGDGRRAFLLLKTFMFAVMDSLIEFHQPGIHQWDKVYEDTWRDHPVDLETMFSDDEYLALQAQYQPTPSEVASIAQEKEQLFRILEGIFDEALCAAIRKYKADIGPKRSVALSTPGSTWSLEFAQRCCDLRDLCGYQARPDVIVTTGLQREGGGSSDSGYSSPALAGRELFPMSRHEMRKWYQGVRAT